mmetsp:Transcript_33972/g.45911  ORF Transcript_33972/g.45911 Transcript_33972/m.45911 type:complete len:106 (-) Transcript_33972:49-366(-)
MSPSHNGTSVALDAYTVNTSTTSNIGIDVDKLLDAEKRVKEAHYEALCTDREVAFFTFSMTSMGRLRSSADHFLRWLANCHPETECGRDVFRRYLSRRIVVCTVK